MTTGSAIPATLDPSRSMLEGLRSSGHVRDAALRQLHAMLIRGAHHELRRRWELLADVPASEIEDLAHQAADDATTAIVANAACFAQLDRYVELERDGEDADAHLPGMRAHLDGCPACHDDCESLRTLWAG